MDLLTRPVNQRFNRLEQQRLAPFIVIEGRDSVGKTFHSEGISLWLTKQGFAVQGLTFPNNQTPLGRFLKRALREQVPLSTWTHHVLFSLHRWEFAPWIVDMLSRNYAVIAERYAWSGTAYSWASDPLKDPYLWERHEKCSSCSFEVNPQQPVFRCFRCTRLVHYVCLMDNSASQKIPICQACGAPSNKRNFGTRICRKTPSRGVSCNPGEPEGTGLVGAGSQDIELRDPYLNPLEEIVLETGSLPCAKHGYDHLSRDSTCEFCKRALGPLHRHLSKKHGRSLGDQTPTLSFDFPLPTRLQLRGARFMLLFVWRLDTVRLLWALAVTGKRRSVFALV